MRNHHIKKNSKSYFEGWYFKHQVNNQSICFIPGIHIPGNSKAFSFVQVITNDQSYFVKYPYEAFYAHKKILSIKIGNNHFTRNGVIIDIDTPQLTIQGRIYYGEFTPIKYDIMGPFSLFPKMECNHGIISLRHHIRGYLKINNDRLSLYKGIGYIEKDWGGSFPSSYMWLQCNDFKDPTSIIVSIAQIPFCGHVFQGLIAIVYYKGKEYRFATYNGSKVLLANKHEVLIRKGRYALKITISKGKAHPLQAPYLGDMTRTIYERPACPARFEFFKGNQRIFVKYSDNSSFEYVDK